MIHHKEDEEDEVFVFFVLSVVKIYTRTGDKGETSLFGGKRVPKNDPRIEAYGTIDELNSHLGLCRSAWPASPIDDGIQSDLFDIGAFLAAPNDDRFHSVAAKRIEDLERAIDAMEKQLEPLKTFIVPGGAETASRLHVARTVCRRAERRIIAMNESSTEMQTTIAYLNRLSDFLFVAARLANRKHGVNDTPWSKSNRPAVCDSADSLSCATPTSTNRAKTKRPPRAGR